MIEKILERLAKLHDSNTSVLSDDIAWRRGVKDAYIEVREVAKEYGKDTNVLSNGWVPCSERLPEAHKNVLVCENDGEIHLCRYNANMKRFFYDGSDWDIKLSEVIAWQPLPAPYQKGEGK